MVGDEGLGIGERDWGLEGLVVVGEGTQSPSHLLPLPLPLPAQPTKMQMRLHVENIHTLMRFFSKINKKVLSD